MDYSFLFFNRSVMDITEVLESDMDQEFKLQYLLTTVGHSNA